MISFYGEKIIIKGAKLGTIQHRFSTEGRPTAAFVLRLNGNVKYLFPKTNESFIGGSGEVIFINKGVPYSVEVTSGEPDYYGIVYLETDLALPDYYRMVADDPLAVRSIIERIIKLHALGGEKRRLNALARLYDMLSICSDYSVQADSDMARYGHIRSAVEYLEEHLFDESLTVEKLSAISGLSGVSFREIFKKAMGMTPRKYIISKRMEQARSMLESDGFALVKDVAEMVGYTDPLYFSRVYKEYFGISPKLSVKMQIM